MKKVNLFAPLACLTIGGALFITSCNHGDSADKYKGEVNLANFDTNVKPQDDFYRYVNGTWLKNNPVPASESSWGSFNVLQDTITGRLRKIVDAASNKHAAKGTPEQKIGDLYYTMMDSVNLNKQGIEPLKGELDKINAISDNKSLWTEAAHLMKIGPDVMFGFGVEQDPHLSTKEVCVFAQGGMTFPAKDYYLQDNKRMSDLREKFLVYAAQIYKQLGESDEMANADAKKLLDVETQMAGAAMSRTEQRDVTATYNKMSLSAFNSMTPNIDWAAVQSELGLPAIDTLIVEQPKFLTQISDLAKSISIDDWKTYMRFHLLYSEASKLSDTLAKINFNFWGRVVRGTTEMQPRWKRSVEATSGSLGPLLGQLYVADYFSPEAKKKVNEMVTNIIAAYKQRIDQVSWMSPDTKKYAQAKLDKIMLKLCYPDKWKDYTALNIERDSWVANSFRINEFETKFDIDKLGKPVDRTEWGMSPQTVNAYYNPSMNEIVFPAAIMQPPFFDPNRDDAMNYGAMGAVIGHELTHGFDDEGSQFDANGNVHKWWTNGDSTQFHKKLGVLINQFNGFEVDSMHVNGSLTIGENTADFGGLTIAYAALQNDLKEHPEGVVDGFTPEQRFFIAWAQAWRENIRPDYQKMLITINPHSPSKFRANAPLSNMPEFYKAFSVSGNEKNPEFRGFDIKPGNGMYRADSIRAAIW